ncbi:Universal stress protein E [Halioglobus japonicus]|nr:Universal stress protein E [Halioglobus japonicus]
MEFRNFFVVYDPTSSEQPALERAAYIASETGVSVHVFACIYKDIPKTREKPGLVRSMLDDQKAILQKEAAPLVAKGLDVTIEVDWDKDWCEAIVRASIKNGADIVLKSSTAHTPGQRIINRTSDWALIRECACAVMLVKGEAVPEAPKVLAAIGVSGGKGTYKQLNQHIVEFSRRVMDNNIAEVHFISAHRDLASAPDRNALVRNYGLDQSKLHILMGEPDEVIVEKAREMNASLVVIGNSARSGISALVNGNTVERVVDKLTCDVLSMP